MGVFLARVDRVLVCFWPEYTRYRCVSGQTRLSIGVFLVRLDRVLVCFWPE